MSILFLIASIIIACGGGYFLFCFLRDRLPGQIVTGEITGFQDKKDKGYPLPVVTFLVEKKSIQEKVTRIDQVNYLINPQGLGARVNILYNPNAKHRCTIYGYVFLMTGLLMFLPLLVMLGREFGKSLFYSQSLFLLLFAIIIGVFWTALKFMQKSK